MSTRYDEDELRALYARLQAGRARSGQPPAIPVEVIQALAEGSYGGDDRAEKLDVVLADPRTAAEFQFFLDLAEARPRPAHRLPVWLPAAAAVVIVLSVALVWRATRPATPDPARGTDGGFLASPAAQAAVTRSTAFVWYSLPDAEDYRFELIDEDGNLVHDAVTTDTTVVLPAAVSLGSADEFRWWVTARLRDGTETVSVPRAVSFRR